MQNFCLSWCDDMQRTVYFERSNGEWVEIGTVDCSNDAAREEMLNLVRDFCNQHNYKIPYYRLWNASEKGHEMTCVDVGSHTEFFWICPSISISTRG